jgi:Putative rhamnosyl transferase
MTIRRDGIFDHSAKYPSIRALNVLMTPYAMVVGWNPGARRKAFRASLPSRLQVFESICMPSVLSQVEQPDLWLLGFAGEWRDDVAPALDAVKEHPWIVPVWQQNTSTGHEHVSACFQKAIYSRLNDTFTHVITTRLDNDDAINRSFTQHLEQYSAAAAHNEPELEDFWISFPFGANYYGSVSRIYTNTTNHFLSRVQTVRHFRATEKSTALAINHNRVFEGRRVFLPITTDPMWLEVVHDNNVTHASARNELLKFKRPETVLARFGVERSGSARARDKANWAAGKAMMQFFRRARRLFRTTVPFQG